MEGKAVEFGEEASIPGDSVGDRLFSLTASPEGVYAGITYRQWLIGQALAGISADPDFAAETCASFSVRVADEVISLIDTGHALAAIEDGADRPEHQCCGGCK